MESDRSGYKRGRYYDPYSQKFLSEDPVGFRAGDTNLNRYVLGNPLRFSDPTGRAPSAPAIIIIGIGIGGIIAWPEPEPSPPASIELPAPPDNTDTYEEMKEKYKKNQEFLETVCEL